MLALDRAGYALRLRRDGDQTIQTFKGRGESLAGFSVRDEWDWYLDRDQLDPQRLAELDLPEVLNSETVSALTPLFRTDFQRTKGLLNWSFAGQPVEVEVALDLGEATAEGQASRICELELELRQGPAEALFAFAHELAAQLPVMPWDSAKAERGYRLVDPQRMPATPTLDKAVFNQPLAQALPVLGSYLLANAQSASEQLSLGLAGAAGSVDHALALMAEFEHLLQCAGVKTADEFGELAERLRRELFVDMPIDAEYRAELFSRLQRHCGWGVLMLGCSERLFLWRLSGGKGLAEGCASSLAELCSSTATLGGLDRLRSEV